MKTCSKCREEKPGEDYYRNRSAPDGRRSVCKTCQNAATRRWREDNPERMAELQREWRQANPVRSREHARRWRARNPERAAAKNAERRDLIDALKRREGCADCGTADGLLHYDHRPGEEKLFNVADGKRYAWDVVLAEIAKCDVRCAPCHARRHAAAECAT